MRSAEWRPLGSYCPTPWRDLSQASSVNSQRFVPFSSTATSSIRLSGYHGVTGSGHVYEVFDNKATGPEHLGRRTCNTVLVFTIYTIIRYLYLFIPILT